MSRALGVAGLALAGLALGLPAPAASAAPAKTPVQRITCAVRTPNHWSTCLGDNVTAVRGKQVFLALNSSSGRRVQFRVKDHRTGKVLATPAIRLAPDGRRHLLWTNRTTRPVTIDVEARTDGRTTARATLSLR